MSGMDINVWAVVVTYNRKEMLIKCLEAIASGSLRPKGVIIIDNAGTDRTYEYLEEKGYSEAAGDISVVYRKLESNLGGAGGFNEGIGLALKKGADRIWIMDDDVIPEEDCLNELISADRLINDVEGTDKVSFLASSIRGADGQAMNVPKITKDQFFKYTDWYGYLDEGIVRIVKATFVSILINAKAVEKCGLPWKGFFIWGDDSEYTQRLIRDYGPAYMVGKSKAIHLRGSAEELSIVKEKNRERIPLYFYYYRNNLIGFWEYESGLYKTLCMGKLFLDLFKVLFTPGCFARFRKAGVIMKAFFNFVTGTYGRKSFKNRALSRESITGVQ